MKKVFQYFLYVITLVLWLFLFQNKFFLLWSGFGNNILNNENRYSLFDEVDDLIDNYYFYDSWVDKKYMMEKSIQAYVDWLKDPYTVFMTAQEESWFEQSLKWSFDFEWIWAVVSKKDYYVLINEVLKKSPAKKAWIRPLDRIIMIWTWNVKDLTISQAVDKIKWKEWTKVNLLIERLENNNEDKKTYEKIEVLREKMSVPSVLSKIFSLSWKNIAYFDIYTIWESTDEILRQDIVDIKSSWDVDWVIIDLRWNWWWYLPVAVQIVSHFIPKWKLVVSAKYKAWDSEEYKSFWYWDLQDIPVVILIDDFSASASEIIALALQEQVWAKLIWIKTFWKGTIQTIEQFKNWDSLKYTVWKWYSPSWKNISHIWIKPDIFVDYDLTGYMVSWVDSQLEVGKKEIMKLLK